MSHNSLFPHIISKILLCSAHCEWDLEILDSDICLIFVLTGIWFLTLLPNGHHSTSTSKMGRNWSFSIHSVLLLFYVTQLILTLRTIQECRQNFYVYLGTSISKECHSLLRFSYCFSAVPEPPELVFWPLSPVILEAWQKFSSALK
jgi:hypothetical protein